MESSESPRFLIIDDNAEARFILNKTLLRRFPKAVIQECQDADPAIECARRGDADVVVVHKVWDMDGATLIRHLRHANACVPIVAMSGIDRSREALAAGATRFLLSDEWLRLGPLVGELLEERRKPKSAAPFDPLSRARN